MSRITLGILLLVVLSSCAPSLRASYRSTVFFEQCHIADFDPQTDIEFKSACWDRWLEHYAEGQPPDRRIYAWERRAALQMGDEPPQLFSRQTEASLHAPSPEVAIPDTANDERRAARRIDGSANIPPPTPCASVCGPVRAECTSLCEDRDTNCEQACAREYGFCVGGCI